MRRRGSFYLWVVIVALSGASAVAGEEYGRHADVSELALLRSADGKAVIQFATGPLHMVAVGDRLGRNQAVVKEIGAGRLVLEEKLMGADGNSNVAQIILRVGETGGKRYLSYPEPRSPPMVRPLVMFPQERDQ